MGILDCAGHLLPKDSNQGQFLLCEAVRHKVKVQNADFPLSLASAGEPHLQGQADEGLNAFFSDELSPWMNSTNRAFNIP